MTLNAPTRLAQLRAASLAMLDGLTAEELRCQSHPELSPLLWHVGHVFFVEHYWLAERVFGDRSITSIWCDLYFPESCPKKTRATRLPDPEAVAAWALETTTATDGYWQESASHTHPLLANGYLGAFIRQHYAQHLETMRLARVQLMRARSAPPPAGAVQAQAPVPHPVGVAAGPVTVGTPDAHACDNEQPCVTLELPAFEIGTACVSNAEWLGFIEAGGYYNAAFWDAEGWAWRQRHDIRHPEHWHASANGWQVPADDPESDDAAGSEQPVHGIGWHEARAFARYSGARLPREAEWEAAARAGALDGLYRVWEWCDDAFHPYPGFRAFPYDGYSTPWFDGAHYVARGASRHSEPEIQRPGFRNFYPATHRHVFAGLRLAW